MQYYKSKKASFWNHQYSIDSTPRTCYHHFRNGCTIIYQNWSRFAWYFIWASAMLSSAGDCLSGHVVWTLHGKCGLNVARQMWFERCTAHVVWTLHGTCCTAAHAEDSLQISHSKVFYLGIWPRFALRETLPLGQLSLLHILLHIPPTHLNSEHLPMYHLHTWTPEHLNTYVPTYTPEHIPTYLHTYLPACLLSTCLPTLLAHIVLSLALSLILFVQKMIKDVQKDVQWCSKKFIDVQRCSKMFKKVHRCSKIFKDVQRCMLTTYWSPLEQGRPSLSRLATWLWRSTSVFDILQLWSTCWWQNYIEPCVRCKIGQPKSCQLRV